MRLGAATAKSGAHLVCYCRDCRAFSLHLGREEELLPGGGSEMSQAAPSGLEILEGAEHLACLRLSPKGPLRWYAACCNSPMAITLPSAKLPFSSLVVARAEDREALPPIRAVAYGEQALPGGAAPPKTRGMVGLVWGFFGRMAGAYLSGKSTVSPFFRGGAPIAVPRVLTREERAAATKG